MTKLSVDKALSKAKSHIRNGQIVEAQRLYLNILKVFPENKKAKQGLAKLTKNKLSSTTQDPPRETIEKLVGLYQKGQLKTVVKTAQVIVKDYPNTFILWNILGASAAKIGNLDEAIKAFQKATVIKPDYHEGFYNMGNALKDQGKLERAIVSYSKAIACRPDYAEAFYNMGKAYADQDNFEKAIEAYQKAIKLKPGYVAAYNNIGNLFQDLGRQQDAISSYERAIYIDPEHAKTYKNLANVMSEQGKVEEALSYYKKALEIEPNYAEVHRNISSLVKYEIGDTHMSLISDLLKSPSIKDFDRCHLNYAYAKMNEDIGNFDVAFEKYVAGGIIRQKLLGYDRKRDSQLFKAIERTAPKLRGISLKVDYVKQNITPIFILGMPRSGTTLVEQIISSHSKVKGAGELKILGNVGGLVGIGRKAATHESLLEVRKLYLSELEKISSGKQFVTDKMPQNFLYIGLILNALPEARIIHVKRDPAATCWSNFKHYFSTEGLGYSYNVKDTVFYFKLYQDLMKFWQRQYGSKIYHLDYDKLTIKQELETKKLIEFLELGWENSCLSPQTNKRSVRTASQQQVRKKVYKGSSEAWLKFEPFLNGVFEQL